MLQTVSKRISTLQSASVLCIHRKLILFFFFLHEKKNRKGKNLAGLYSQYIH